MSMFSRIIDRLTGRDPHAPARLPSPDELTLLTRPHGEPEAELLKGMLEQEGIRSMVKNRDAISARGSGLGAPWAYELWVLRKDLRRAREIIGPDEDERAE